MWVSALLYAVRTGRLLWLRPSKLADLREAEMQEHVCVCVSPTQ